MTLTNDTVSMTTYKHADGSPVDGEYGWVTDIEGYFDDDEEPVELLEEVWVRTTARTFWHFPTNVECYGDGEDDIDCTGDDQWVDGSTVWMYLCAAHREHVAALAAEHHRETKLTK